MADEFDYSTLLGDVSKNLPGALQQAQKASAESLDLQRQALDTFRGALSQRGGPDIPLLMLAGAIGAPTKTGSFGESLASGATAYGGALQKAQDSELSRAEKLQRIMMAQAELARSAGMAPMDHINRTLGAAQSISTIDQLRAAAEAERAYRGFVGGGGGASLPPSGVGAVAAGTDPITQRTQAAAATGDVNVVPRVENLDGIPEQIPPSGIPPQTVAQSASIPPAAPMPPPAAPASPQPATPSSDARPAQIEPPEGAYRLPQAQAQRARQLQDIITRGSSPQYVTNEKVQRMVTAARAEIKNMTGGDDFAIDAERGIAYPVGKSTPAYQKAQAAAKRAEQPSAVEKDLDETYIDLQKSARAAPQRLAELQQLDQALSNTWTGKLADITMPGRQLLKATVGIDIGNISEAEFAQTMANKTALALRNPAGGAGMPGALSDGDRKYLAAMTANIDKSPEGNKKIMQMAIAVEKRNMEVASMARQYAQQNGGKIDDRFFQQLSAWSEQNPLIPQSANASRRSSGDGGGNASTPIDPVEAEMRRRGLIK